VSNIAKQAEIKFVRCALRSRLKVNLEVECRAVSAERDLYNTLNFQNDKNVSGITGIFKFWYLLLIIKVGSIILAFAIWGRFKASRIKQV
jgi:hypothetical protein